MHTPGPWKIETDEKGRPSAIGHNNILIASLSGKWPEANARLIAAAPELLATLQGILTYVEDGNVVELRPCGFIEEVKATIAKATT